MSIYIQEYVELIWHLEMLSIVSMGQTSEIKGFWNIFYVLSFFFEA